MSKKPLIPTVDHYSLIKKQMIILLPTVTLWCHKISERE